MMGMLLFPLVAAGCQLGLVAADVRSSVSKMPVAAAATARSAFLRYNAADVCCEGERRIELESAKRRGMILSFMFDDHPGLQAELLVMNGTRIERR